MNNNGFLNVARDAFKEYLESSARSTKKLYVLHGAIANDLNTRLNDSSLYSICSLGFGDDKEGHIEGRYVDKRVDITVLGADGNPIAGIAVKYVMSNYKQNATNYFENMLGETANIRSANIPYYQLFIIPEKLPYFKADGTIGHWEYFNKENMKKYLLLSKDNPIQYQHTPDKTLVAVLDFIPEAVEVYTKSEYKEFYLKHDFKAVFNQGSYAFSKGVIFNDYDKFMEKVVHAIKSI